MSQQTEQIEGALSRIIFKNDSGFLIGAFIDQHNNKFTAVGNMINPQISLDYIFDGRWVEDHRYGEQFKFHTYETILPIDTNGIFKYIVRVCRFVGAAVGNTIVEKYGGKTLEVMRTDPERLARDISGVTISRAHEIQATLLENEGIEKVMCELELMLDIPGMRKSLPTDLIAIYKTQAAEAIKENPYRLTRFPGIGFSLADRVALNIGYARDSIERKKAATLHCMAENMQAGSVWISEKNLVENIQALIQVPNLTEGVHALISDEIIVCDGEAFALTKPAQDEDFIASIIATLGNIEVVA